MSKRHKVCIIGSGNWASLIAKIVGENVIMLPNFDNRVTMYVYDETINGKKLPDIINETRENVKYLPGHKLPDNVVAIPDVVDAAKDANILFFIIPKQLIRPLCLTLFDKLKSNAIGLSFIKGIEKSKLASQIINRHLKIPCAVLTGTNFCEQIANNLFCETTIGCHNLKIAYLLTSIIETDYFRGIVVEDKDCIEMCSALKSIVAIGAGFIDGLGFGHNTKGVVIRLGLIEMIKFVDMFYPSSKLITFFTTCIIPDLILACYCGRDRRLGEAFVRTGKTFQELESVLFNGQKVLGPLTAKEVAAMLKKKGIKDEFHIFTCIHRICTGELRPVDFVDFLQDHPKRLHVPKRSFT